ncbi:MAG TPA: MBL fold metallo-hydrolase [Acidimicrobiales bacterium]|nr:MBL fold metallo-hydrolase [Acidimicrobiales bacterium]
MEPMTPITTEIADDVYRISTWIPDVSPEGFTFNQFLVVADEPLLFHTGHRGLFPLVSGAVAEIVPLESLRWISFGHVEADESGSMNMFLVAAPDAQVVHTPLAVDVSLNDLCDRPPVGLAEGEVLDLGGKRIRSIATPHVPHGWEAHVLYEETTGTLLCGDLFSHVGAPPPLTSGDLVGPALAAETMFGAMSMAPHTGATLRGLADLQPQTLAIMHGSSFAGDGAQALRDLAVGLEERVATVPA